MEVLFKMLSDIDQTIDDRWSVEWEYCIGAEKRYRSREIFRTEELAWAAVQLNEKINESYKDLINEHEVKQQLWLDKQEALYR